jgi:hypothetical protein
MFHKSNMGRFGDGLPCDRNGYVGEEGDALDSFAFNFTAEEEEDAEYVAGWFREWLQSCVAETARASRALEQWRERG